MGVQNWEWSLEIVWDWRRSGLVKEIVRDWERKSRAD
jgi:hypothetical protein